MGEKTPEQIQEQKEKAERLKQHLVYDGYHVDLVAPDGEYILVKVH